MTAVVRGGHPRVARAGAALLATLIAGLIIGYALAVSGRFEARYAVAGIAAAVPVGLALAVPATAWPRQAALGLVGLLAFAAFLLVRATLAEAPDPLLAAVAVTVIVTAGAVLAGRARPSDLLAALLLGYAGAALIYEITIGLHNL